MRLLYYSRRRKPELEAALGLRYRALPELLAEADFVTLHCALTPDTRGILNREAFRRMKPSAMVVNTGRGGLIDQAALLEAIREGRIAGASGGQADAYPSIVAACWSLGVDLAEQIPPGDLARPALALVAMLDPNGIPGAVLTSDAACAYLRTFDAPARG